LLSYCADFLLQNNGQHKANTKAFKKARLHAKTTQFALAHVARHKPKQTVIDSKLPRP
jgi:hypothetical protein